MRNSYSSFLLLREISMYISALTENYLLQINVEWKIVLFAYNWNNLA